MSVGKARGELWAVHLDPLTTPEKLEGAATRFVIAKQRASDRRDKWKLRRLSKSRLAAQHKDPTRDVGVKPLPAQQKPPPAFTEPPGRPDDE